MEMNHVRWGGGEPLSLLHGLGTSWRGGPCSTICRGLALIEEPTMKQVAPIATKLPR